MMRAEKVAWWWWFWIQLFCVSCRRPSSTLKWTRTKPGQATRVLSVALFHLFLANWCFLMLPNKCIYITADFSSNWRSGELFLTIYLTTMVLSYHCHVLVHIWKAEVTLRASVLKSLIIQPENSNLIPIWKKPPPKVLLSVGCRRLGVSKWPLGLDIVSQKRLWISHKPYQSPALPSPSLSRSPIKMHEGWTEFPKEDINNLVILMVEKIHTVITHAWNDPLRSSTAQASGRFVMKIHLKSELIRLF